MYKLNQNQLKAIYYNKGSLNVSAGPGTGKTTVLIERVKYLVNQLNISPKDILILSFNKNTVKDIKKRLLIEDIKIMTFHGLSTSILKKNISLLNNKYNDDFEIIDDFKKECIIKNIIKTSNKTNFAEGFSDVKSLISKIKNNTISLKNNNFYIQYQNYLYNYNLVDFDDLNKYTYQTLSDNKKLLSDYETKYCYVLIDEIQDIDFYQYQLINLLFKKVILFIIGDLNQSIYSFRGSKNIYIDLLLANFNLPTFYLNINYRNPYKIVELANNLINYNYESCEKDKYKIKAFIKDNFNSNVFYYRFIDSYIESTFVVSKIKELIKDNKYKYSDIVVLYRNNYLFDNLLKDTFFVNRIPYFINGTEKTIFIKPKKKLNCNFDNNEELNWIKQSLAEKQKEIELQSHNQVLLSTIHQIKGLEFKIVFLIGFEKETFMYDFFCNVNIKEERRLTYVAITRAKEQLYITSVSERYVFGCYQKLKPASFLQEMGIKGDLK